MPREKGKPAASRAEQREGWRTGWRARFKKGEGKSVSAWKICCSQNNACTSFYLFSSPLFSLSLFLLISSFLLPFFSFWLFFIIPPFTASRISFVLSFSPIHLLLYNFSLLFLFLSLCFCQFYLYYDLTSTLPLFGIWLQFVWNGLKARMKTFGEWAVWKTIGRSKVAAICRSGWV